MLPLVATGPPCSIFSCEPHKVLPRLLFSASQACIQTQRDAVASLCELETVVNGSACQQLVGTEDGTSHVPVSDWQDHLRRSTNLCPGSRRSNTSGIIKSSQRALISDLHVSAWRVYYSSYSVDRFDSAHRIHENCIMHNLC